ncbi:endothelin-converting enzyme 1-like [Gordionus sp. m RMFG-2023]|uniref:endothelin-converting enzyme 1-like n=1 Tax=Gordionus sp. m RMFG-2023 TaxID=3053472 RepID=UPI0031FC9F01
MLHQAHFHCYQFGAIGSVITHEIGHGFDVEGRKYDKSGNWNLWWTNKSIEAFLDGKRTLRENIADNGGVSISLKALKSYQAKKRRDEYAFKSNTVEDRLFFLAYAQSHCSKDTPEALYERIRSGFHSPDKYRVNGVLSNFKQFSEAFSCSAKSAMNPPNKCTIW